MPTLNRALRLLSPSLPRPHSATPRPPLRATTHIPHPYSSSLLPRRCASTLSRSGSNSTWSQLLRPATIVLIFVPILTGFLGIWQIRRLRWKVALIEEVDRNLSREPMVLPNRINLDALPEFSFRRVLVKGHFSGPPILLGPQVKDGVPGYNLILPVVRPNGTTILLNRGFITTTRAAAIRAGTETAPGLSPAGEPTEEEVVVEGMLLRQGEKTVWTHENNKEGNEWFWRDVLAMAEWVGGEAKGVQPVLVDAIEGGSAPSSLLMQQGIPVGRPAQVDLRNQHASYAMTWLSLCAATSAMLVFVLRKGKGGPKPRRTI